MRFTDGSIRIITGLFPRTKFVVWRNKPMHAIEYIDSAIFVVLKQRRDFNLNLLKLLGSVN